MQARWGLLEGSQLAVIEMAAAAGLMLVPADKRDAAKTTTYGVGQLILAACDSGVERLIVGVGGSATNDGGSGMAQALGIRFFDTDDVAIDAALCGGMLLDIARIEVSGRNRLLDNVTITVASDVDNPLTGPHGATHVFGSQKGATPAQIEKLDAGLNQLAQIIHRDLGLNVEDIPGAGAAGGLGGGLIAFAGATIEPGIRLVLDAVGFRQPRAWLRSLPHWRGLSGRSVPVGESMPGCCPGRQQAWRTDHCSGGLCRTGCE